MTSAILALDLKRLTNKITDELYLRRLKLSADDVDTNIVTPEVLLSLSKSKCHSFFSLGTIFLFSC